MFITLPESSRRGKRPTSWTLMSVTAHTIALGAWFANQGFTTSPTRTPAEEPPIFVRPAQSEPETRPVHRGDVIAPGGPIVDVVLPTVQVPEVNLPTIPSPAGSPTFDPAAYERRGTVPFASAPTASSTPEFGRVYNDRTVDRRVEPRPGNPIPRYPPSLAHSGIEGSVTVRFIVDTLGKVDRSSVRVLHATHALFEQSVREALVRMRYIPAELGNAKVAQLVELPFHFAIRR